MSSGQTESVYAVARRHILWTIAAMPVIVWGVPLLLSAFGVSSEVTFAVIVPLGLAWALIGGLRSLMIACPRCGKSLFMRGIISVPWPARRCSRCRADLTVCPR